MTRTSDHQAWLQAYGEAWERRDPDAAAALFVDDATYAWGPFADPLRGREAIHRAIATATRENQADVSFGFEQLAVTDDGRGIARWWAEMGAVAAQQRMRMEGIFLVTLEDDGRCSVFREWWNEDPPGTGASDYE